MEIIQYLIDNFSTSENSTIAIITICVVIYLSVKLLKWIVSHRGDIKSFFDSMYTRRQVHEEMVDKINTSYDVGQQSLNEIQTMQNNYVGYREQSLEIQKQLTDMLNILTEKTKVATEKSDNLSNMVLGIRNALIEIMNDRITQKCNYYSGMGGIPENELGDFQRMFDVYSDIGGNHGLEARFEKTKAELPLIPTRKMEE